MEWVFFVSMVVSAGTASLIGWKVKGRPLTGFLLGFLLNWLGVIIIALIPRTYDKKVEKAVRERQIQDDADRRRAGYQPPGYAEAGPDTLTGRSREYPLP